MKREGEWAAYVYEVTKRLRKGEEVYKDRTFSLSPEKIAGEIEEELFDVAAYAFILWCRIRELRTAVTEAAQGVTISLACNGVGSEFGIEVCNRPRMHGALLCEYHWNLTHKSRRNA